MHTTVSRSSVLVWVCVLVLLSAAPRAAHALRAQVAIYNDTAYTSGGAWAQGIAAIKAMLQTYGYSYEDVTPNQLNTTDLRGQYRVLLVPGGWAGGYATYLTQSGFNNIRSFVSEGGGYFGICAGAYLAADMLLWTPDRSTAHYSYNYVLDLFPGIAAGAVYDIIGWNDPTGCGTGTIAKGAAMTTVTVNSAVVSGLPAELSILYYGGPFFRVWQGVTFLGPDNVVASYKVSGSMVNGQAAMVLLPFGKGQVFLTGPHPEIEFSGCAFAYDTGGTRGWKLMNAMLQKLMAQ